MNLQSEKKARNRTELLLLVLVFSAPFIAAWLIYNYIDRGILETTNYGDLITPPVLISNTPLTETKTGQEKDQLYGRWSLVYLLTGECLEQCQKDIDMMSHLRLALGKNADRLQVIVATDQSASSLINNLPQGFNWNHIFIINRADLNPAVDNNSIAEIPMPDLKQGFYLVDPIGNLMMRYDTASDGAGILGDIKRLLRYSRVG